MLFLYNDALKLRLFSHFGTTNMFTSHKTSSQVILLMCSALFLFSACSERKPMTAEEKWQRFCITYQSAAYNIMSDRQHQVTEQQAIEHVEKIQAGVERDMLIALVKQAHQSPAFDQQDDKEKELKANADAEKAKELKAQEIKDKMKSVDVKEDVKALVGNESDLSDEFKQKASTIFEAAVRNKLADEVIRLEDEYADKVKTDTETAKNEIVEKVDGYLNYIVEEWMKENELAIERGIRSELVEDFMAGLKTLFAEHYIDIPEEKVDMVDDLFTKVEDLETSLDEEINRGVELQKELAQFKKDDALRDVTKDLADTEIEKFKSLTDDVCLLYTSDAADE